MLDLLLTKLCTIITSHWSCLYLLGQWGTQEYMFPPTSGAPHVRGRPPGDTGYGMYPAQCVHVCVCVALHMYVYTALRCMGGCMCVSLLIIGIPTSTLFKRVMSTLLNLLKLCVCIYVITSIAWRNFLLYCHSNYIPYHVASCPQQWSGLLSVCEVWVPHSTCGKCAVYVQALLVCVCAHWSSLLPTDSGRPPPTWAPPQPFLPRQEVPYPHDVRQHVGQHQGVCCVCVGGVWVDRTL